MRKSKGITLVALIITIIILLILAGISIASLTKSGLFIKAQEAKQKTENTQLEEEKILGEYEELITSYIGITNVDTNNTNPEAAMPEGALLIEGDATKGIVIKDSKYNEWVWVEVPKTIFAENVDNETDYDNIKDALITYASDYRASDYTDEWYEGCGVADNATYTEMYNKMLSSVYANGGFWISRYAIGDSTATKNNITRTGNSSTTGIAVSQVDMIPYNYVTCSEAQSLASGMSTDESKISSLLFGIQWDLTCKFIEEKTDLEVVDIKKNSEKWGNYCDASIMLTRGKYNKLPDSLSGQWVDIITGSKNGTILLTTGASEDAKKMNIYDFAGNLWEWTLERKSDNSRPCVSRSGGYSDTVRAYSASSHISYRISYRTYGSGGFRSTLY